MAIYKENKGLIFIFMANGFTYGINFPFRDSRRGDYLELTQLESQQIKSDLISLTSNKKRKSVLFTGFWN